MDEIDLMVWLRCQLPLASGPSVRPLSSMPVCSPHSLGVAPVGRRHRVSHAVGTTWAFARTSAAATINQ
jgi:hypothetical protein